MSKEDLTPAQIEAAKNLGRCIVAAHGELRGALVNMFEMIKAVLVRENLMNDDGTLTEKAKEMLEEQQ